MDKKAKKKEFDTLVTSFQTVGQYKAVEGIFDIFGGRFSVKKNGDVFEVYSSSADADLYNYILENNSIVFMV